MIGIDLVEHKDIINKEDKFIRKILSNLEYEIYSNIKSKKRQIEYAASRFASKEALFKAYKIYPEHISFQDISILNDPITKAPYVKCDKLNDNIEISLTHTDNYSVAIVLVHIHDSVVVSNK